MNQIEALQAIRRLGVSTFETRDISALLRVTPANASILLGRLARAGLVRRVSHGRWAMPEPESRELIVEQLSAPYPAYISLHSALFRHGIVEQVPAVTYAVTLGRARRYDSPLGSVSFHHVPPVLFGGFELTPSGAKVAKPEKAFFDLIYLSPTRSRLFARLPEVEFPRSFRWSEVHHWIAEIPDARRRTSIKRKLAEFKSARPPLGPGDN